MKILFKANGDPGEIREGIQELASADYGTVGVFACADNGLTPGRLDPVLQSASVVLFGGIFPDIIYEDERYSRGAVLLGIRARCDCFAVRNISDPELNFDELFEDTMQAPTPETMFVLVDGYARRITTMVDALFNSFGLDANYLGGGAGDLSFESKPCIITGEGLLSDAAVFVFTALRSGVGVRHGWRSHRGPYRITRASANVVQSIDWRPAGEVYREIIAEQDGAVDPDFMRRASAYPLGIKKIGAEYVVRDPVASGPDGAVVFVGEVPEESLVDVLCAHPDELARAAGEATRVAEKSLPDYDQMIFIDCISRALFLGDKFASELAAARPSRGGRFGMLSIGEIANNGQSYLDFYNKTAVAGFLKEV